MTISEVAILETKDDERDERRGAVVCGSSTVQSDWQSDAVGTGQDSTSRGTTKLYKCMYVWMCMEDEASHIRCFCLCQDAYSSNDIRRIGFRRPHGNTQTLVEKIRRNREVTLCMMRGK